MIQPVQIGLNVVEAAFYIADCFGIIKNRLIAQQ